MQLATTKITYLLLTTLSIKFLSRSLQNIAFMCWYENSFKMAIH